MARPKREIIPVKTHTLVVRLDDIQYSIIEKYAKQLGISMAEYIRRQATQGKVEISYPVVADIEQLQKLTDEFHAIGNKSCLFKEFSCSCFKRLFSAKS